MRRKMTMNKDYKCPFCGTSDFKVENGYYVCQICGNQTPVEEKPQKEVTPKIKKQLEKSADKLIPLIIYSFLALITIIPVLQNMEYFEYYEGISMMLWVFDLLCGLAMICFVGITFSLMKGKTTSSAIKNLLFGTYTFCRVVITIVLMILNERFIFINLVYDVIYIALVWFTTYKFAKWINK